MTQDEVQAILSEQSCKDVIESQEFYLQKGQDALIKWRDLVVSDSIRSQLIELSQDYEKLKQLENQNSNTKQVFELLYEIISYCDVHAKEKEKYNKYDDKRTIAKAGVRMGNWMAGLIKFKFKQEQIKGHSIINAFNYLLNPQNNVPILSENHREEISTTIFKKDYDPGSFLGDLKNYFAQFNIKVENQANLTYVLSILTYEMSDAWKEEVVGLMSSDGTKWQDGYMENMKGYDAGIVWNSKKPSGTNDTIKFLKNIIEDGESFPLYYSAGGFVNYKAEIIDFALSQEDLDKKKWDKNHKVLNYQNKFSDYKDSKKGATIVFLAKNVTSVDPIPVDTFGFYKGWKAPTQDNLSPLKEEPSNYSGLPNLPFIANQFDSMDLNNYILFLRSVIDKFGLKQGDERLVFSTSNNNLNFIIGQRHCLRLLKNDLKGKYFAISKEKLNEESRRFEGSELVPYYTQFNEIDFVKSNSSSIYNAMEYELKRTKKSGYRSSNNVEFENYVFGTQAVLIDKKLNDMSLNQILYGPPGTGKTYNSITKAINIVNRDFDTSQERSKLKEEYNRLEKEGNILFSTFHQSMSYEDFIEGIKPLSPKPGEALNYDIQAGIFKIACARAGYLCYKKYNQLRGVAKLNYTFDDLYSAFIESIKSAIESKQFPSYDTITGKKVEIFEINSQDSIKARAKGSKTTNVAPLTKDNIEKLYNRFNSVSEIENLELLRDTVQVSPRSTEFYAVFGGLKEFEKKYKPDSSIIEEDFSVDIIEDAEKIKKFTAGIYNDAIKQYGKEADPVVLILDEINRGNVSQIFGELITLIEDDKRIGCPESLQIILPYSKSKFGVPPNLHIVGTMNTADRSVEALDTALRRRFVFEEIPPKYELKELQYDIAGVKAFEILKTINKRIEKLLDKDHLIGHSYFIIKDGENADKKLIDSFYKNIIPLLQEYFFGDFGKIGLVLGQGFVNLKNWDDKVDAFAEFDHESAGDFESRDVYEIIDYRKQTNYKLNNVQMDFSKAIKRLMNLSIE